jgi:hypothetical protein
VGEFQKKAETSLGFAKLQTFGEVYEFLKVFMSVIGASKEEFVSS